MTDNTPGQLLNQLICGYWNSQAVYVAAKLGIADLLKDGPRSVKDIAEQTGTHEPSLYRLLRALASLGLFSEGSERRFALMPAATLLQSDVPGSQRATAMMMGEEHYRAWGDLLGSVQTGATAFEKIYGKPVFEYLSEHPEQAALFDKAMVGIHGRETAAIAEAYDFSALHSITDIGGGNGSMLCGILASHPHLLGTLYDLPGVIQRANRSVQTAGLTDRAHLVAGDFFESVPGGADAYLLRHIIHDWDEERAQRILENVHRELKPEGRVLVIESVIPPGNEPSFGKLLDLTMLVIPGGRERTAEEYHDLFGKAGLRLVRIIPTSADVSIIEGVPA